MVFPHYQGWQFPIIVEYIRVVSHCSVGYPPDSSIKYGKEHAYRLFRLKKLGGTTVAVVGIVFSEFHIQPGYQSAKN